MNRESGTGKYEQLLVKCESLEPIATAVVHPREETALAGAIEASAKGLITPILVGPVAKIREISTKLRIDLGATEIVDAPHSHGAAARAVELVGQGRAELLMKGSLHTDEFLTSRADSVRSRIASCAIATLAAHARRKRQ
jgi:phosphate acetyltransferase